MDAVIIKRIETGAERGASVLFATAVAYAAYGVLDSVGIQPQIGFAAGALAYLACSFLLAIAARSSAQFALPEFTLRQFEFVDAPDELLLTDALGHEELLLTDRLGSPNELVLTDADRVEAAIPLVLDDILEEIGPESRVVRLFDRKAMPTAGQLQSRIAEHLQDGTPARAPSHVTPPSDASHALSAALADLRRSLR